jgi:hypothetical protein
MQTGKSFKPEVRKKTGRKILKWLLAFAAALIVLAFLFVPMFVSSEKCRRLILSKINNSIAGRTDFADLSMGWWKGVKVADFSFDDNKGQISVRIKQIAAKPHYASLLTGSLSFGETLVDEPKVLVNLKNRQITQAPQQPAPGGKPQFAMLPIKNIDLVVKDGNLKVTDAQARTVELSQINSKVNLRPLGQTTNFNINTTVVDKTRQSQISASGAIAAPATKQGWSLKGTTGNLTVEVNDLNLQSLTPLFALADVNAQTQGHISADIKSQIKDGRFENLSAVIKGNNLDITSPQLKGDRFQTSSLDADVKLTRAEEVVTIDKLRVKTDWADLSAAGAVPTTLKSLSDFLKPDSNYSLKGTFDCNLPAVLSQMPRTLGLKEGTKISSGKLTGSIETLAQAGRKYIQGSATLTGLQGTYEGKNLALSQPLNAQAQISSDKTAITFDKLDVSASFAKVTCTGNTELLKFDVDVDLAKFQSELGQFADLGPYQVAGRLTGTGQLSLKENKIAAAGTSTVKGLRLSSKQTPAASEATTDGDIAFAFDVDRQNDILSISSLKADTTLGRVDIKDAVLPLSDKAAKPIRLNVTAAGLDLQKVQPFAVLFASFPKEMQLAGIADSSISIISEKDTYAVATDSTKIRNLKFLYPGQQPFEANQVSLVFDARVNPKQKTINVKKLQLISPQIKIHKAELTELSKAGKTQMQGQIDCEYDWAAVSTVAAPFLPQGLKLQGQRKDIVTFTSEYPAGQTDKRLANLNTKARLGFERADYMGLNFGPTQVDIQVRNGLLKIAPFSTTVNNGQFNFAAQADFNQKPAMLKTAAPIQIAKDIQINDATSKSLLMYLNPIFANALNVTGVASFNCEQLAIPISASEKNRIEVVGTVSMNKLRLQASDLLGQIFSVAGTGAPGVDLTIHPTKFVLQNGTLSYDDMQIDVGNSPLNFKGSIGLDKSLNMTITLPYTIEGKTARVGKETPGQRITLALKGTLDKPRLDLGKILEEQLRQRLIEGLDKLLK